MRIAVVGLSVAAGIGIAIVAIMYLSSPRQTVQRAWNKTAITADLHDIGFVKEDNQTGFGKLHMDFVLTNNSGSDFALEKNDSFRIFIRYKNPPAMLADTKDTLQLPVLVVPGEKSLCSLNHESVFEDYDRGDGFHLVPDDRKLKDAISNISGFVIFDSVNRYQIEIPIRNQ